MYAVVRTGGKQYRVGTGDIIEVEKLDGDVGQEITLDDVLLVSNGEQIEIGQPKVESASVQATITGQYRGPKILSFRYRPKKRIRVRKGHRQHVTRLEIKSVSLNGASYTDVMELGPTPKVKPKKEKKTYVPIAAPAADVVEDATEDVVEEVESTVETNVESVETSVESVEANVSDAVEASTESVETAAEDVADTASDAVSAAEDVASDAVEDVTDAAEDAASDAADTVDGDNN